MARPNPAHGRWRLMPEQEPIVLLVQQTPGVFVGYAVPRAWQRDRTVAERSPTGAVYVGKAKDWFLPKELLPGVAPKPGDRIEHVTEAGMTETETVQTRDVALAQTVWRLGCLSLELAFGLTDLIDVETYLLGKDTSLGTTRVPTPFAQSVKCRIQLLTEQAARERGLEYSEGQVEITVERQLPGLDVVESVVTDRATGQKYAVVSYRQPRRIEELPVIVAKAQM